MKLISDVIADLAKLAAAEGDIPVYVQGERKSHYDDVLPEVEEFKDHDTGENIRAVML